MNKISSRSCIVIWHAQIKLWLIKQSNFFRITETFRKFWSATDGVSTKCGLYHFNPRHIKHVFKIGPCQIASKNHEKIQKSQDSELQKNGCTYSKLFVLHMLVASIPNSVQIGQKYRKLEIWLQPSLVRLVGQSCLCATFESNQIKNETLARCNGFTKNKNLADRTDLHPWVN